MTALPSFSTKLLVFVNVSVAAELTLKLASSSFSSVNTCVSIVGVLKADVWKAVVAIVSSPSLAKLTAEELPPFDNSPAAVSISKSKTSSPSASNASKSSISWISELISCSVSTSETTSSVADGTN